MDRGSVSASADTVERAEEATIESDIYEGNGMNIAIVGAGKIGGALTRHLTAAGHHVRIANRRGPQTLAELAAETGAVPSTLAEVAEDAQVVIVSVTMDAIAELRMAGLVLPDDAVVVDTNNYAPVIRDRRFEELDNGVIESRWAERQLAHPVVKVFNTIPVADLRSGGVPAGTPGRIALPIAGDSPAAKATMIDLIDQIGFDAVDAGGLDDSWRQQSGTPVFAVALDAEGVRKGLTEAHPAQTKAWRAHWVEVASA
ncbi:NADPH-dependent F420 reductase [Micromonospora musae]|uniref:NADPH-dependent F420 reductase n=1 Tax=Micromonospora musae TaxID=1894970 RepID=UPI0033E044D1